MIFICIFIIICFSIYIYSLKKKIKNISKQVNLVLYGQKEVYEQSYLEGQLSLLENDIAKLTYRLQEQNHLLLKEKNLLKESLEDISHQIKTPLTSLNLIQERLKNVDDREKIKLLKEQKILLYRIEWLVHVLLKIAQIDGKTIEFKKENIISSLFFKQILAPFEMNIELKDIQVSINNQDIQLKNIDILWTQEALSNIIKNCIEHLNYHGILNISVSNNPLYQQIIIEDTGGGIDEQDLPHIFERFYTGKNNDKDSVGIGLALACKIIENQNGTISVENTDVGVRFKIHFYKEII